VGGVLAAGVSGAGVPALFGLLLAMEAGVPVLVPADLVILLLERRGAAALATGRSAKPAASGGCRVR
jgi:hypothetical protein